MTGVFAGVNSRLDYRGEQRDRVTGSNQGRQPARINQVSAHEKCRGEYWGEQTGSKPDGNNRGEYRRE